MEILRARQRQVMWYFVKGRKVEKVVRQDGIVRLAKKQRGGISYKR